MMVKFVEAIIGTNKVGYIDAMTLKEIFVNPVQVVALKERKHILDNDLKAAHGLDARVEFTEIHLANGTNIIVAGSMHVVQAKLGASTKQLLRG